MLKSRLFPFLLLVILLLPGIWSLFHHGFFLSDDGQWMIIRFSAFYENLINGQFPVRFLSRLNNGYGYPVADFLYPLFMYIGVPIKALGVSFQDTIKIILGVSLFAGGFFGFLWLRKLFHHTAALIGALIYSLFPYHLWDIYKRGSVGEILALSILPFTLWQIERKNLTLVSLSLGALIVSHNTLALLFIPIMVVYMLLKTNLKFMLLTIVLGLGISSFFWAPAVHDIQFTIFRETQVSNFFDHFVNQSSLNLFGLISPAILILSIVFFKKEKNFIFFLLIALISTFLTFEISAFVWEWISPLIQFPFRFISLTMFGLTFLGAFILAQLRGNTQKVVAIVVLILVFISARDFFVPYKFQDYPDVFYSTNQSTTTIKNEYMPKWVKHLPSSFSSKVEVVEGTAKVFNIQMTANKIMFDTKGRGEIQVNTVYFPGWRVYIDGNEAQINYEENGLIRFNVLTSESNTQVKFTETNFRLLFDFISIISLALIIGWLRFR